MKSSGHCRTTVGHVLYSTVSGGPIAPSSLDLYKSQASREVPLFDECSPSPSRLSDCFVSLSLPIRTCSQQSLVLCFLPIINSSIPLISLNSSGRTQLPQHSLNIFGSNTYTLFTQLKLSRTIIFLESIRKDKQDDTPPAEHSVRRG